MEKDKNGCIYLRGRFYWIKYYQRGKAIYESTKSDTHKVAVKLLLQREIEADQDRLPNFQAEKTKWDELAEDYLRTYRVEEYRSLRRAHQHINNLRPHFSGYRAHDIGTDTINKFIDKQKEAGYSNATINRQLSTLRRMFNIGIKQTPQKVLKVPYVKLLPEDNVREGFFEHDEFLALRAALPDHLRAVVTIAYYTGMRKAEILGLKWHQIDFREGTIRLSHRETKTKKSRAVPMNDEIWSLLMKQKRDRDLLFPDMPFVFYTPKGEPIESFRKTWITACKKVGVEGKIFHDFRRTGVRNMTRSGVPEVVAMAISGHRTRSVFDRYNIVSEDDLKLAARKVENYTKAKMEAESPFKELEELEGKTIKAEEHQ